MGVAELVSHIPANMKKLDIDISKIIKTKRLGLTPLVKDFPGVRGVSVAYIVCNVKKFEKGEDDPTVSFGIEMVELYVEDYDEKRFLIPDDYEFVD